LLGLAIALQFGGVYASVLISDAQRDVGNALGARDLPGFRRGVGTMIAFMLLGVVVPSYSEWITQRIRVRWRRWFTGHYITRWIGPHAYCQGELHRGQLDNPDVRIAEDVRDFVSSALGLSLSMLASIVTLLSFGAMLWNLSSAWAIPIAGKTTQIPGLMLWIAVGFALFSMWITNVVGRKLTPSTSTGSASRPTFATASCVTATRSSRWRSRTAKRSSGSVRSVASSASSRTSAS
jgi:putative ATP-binding cassette transporter